jgi:uncharacterized protein YukJ
MMISKVNTGNTKVPLQNEQSDIGSDSLETQGIHDIHMNQGNVQAAQAKPVSQSESHHQRVTSQAAEIKQQADARAAELHAKLDKSGPDDQEGQNIIAVLIGL